MPDALGYQKINTLDEVESMPSFLDKQVGRQETIVKKQADEQTKNAKIVADALDSTGKNSFLLNDYYQKEYTDFRNYGLDLISKNMERPLEALNNTEFKRRQLRMSMIPEVGNAINAEINKKEQELYTLHSLPLDHGGIDDATYQDLQKQIENTGKEWSQDEDPLSSKAQQKLFSKLGSINLQKRDIPFDFKKGEDLSKFYGDDPHDNNKKIVNPDTIINAALSNYNTPEGKKHYDTLFEQEYKGWSDNKKKEIQDDANALSITPQQAFAIKQHANANQPKSKHSNEAQQIALGRLFNDTRRTDILGAKSGINEWTVIGSGKIKGAKGEMGKTAVDGVYRMSPNSAATSVTVSVPMPETNDNGEEVIKDGKKVMTNRNFTGHIVEIDKNNNTITLTRGNEKDKNKKDVVVPLDQDMKDKFYTNYAIDLDEAIAKVNGIKGTPSAGGNKGTSGKTPTSSLNQ